MSDEISVPRKVLEEVVERIGKILKTLHGEAHE